MSRFGNFTLFEGTVANGQTVYIGVPIHDGVIGLQVAWLDATASATVTLELTSWGVEDAPVSDAGSAWHWKGSGETITGPAASAAGSTLIHLENVRQRRARLKIVGAAASPMVVLNGAA
jgi:hypothetical protein